MSETTSQPLITETVDAVFAACTTRYGQAYFLSRWEGTQLGVVKADWARVLVNLSEREVRHGLANLPDKPPMAHEFRDIAKCVPPAPQALALPAPLKTPPRIAAALRKVIKATASDQAREDPLGWARDLEQRERDGERLSIAQRESWRQALGVKSPIVRRPE